MCAVSVKKAKCHFHCVLSCLFCLQLLGHPFPAFLDNCSPKFTEAALFPASSVGARTADMEISDFVML